MKRFKTTVFSLIVVMILLVALAVPSFGAATSDAKEPVDTSAACTLTLEYKYEDTVMPGLEILLYRIANFTADFQYELTGSFEGKSIAVNGIKTQTEWDELASTLSGLIALEQIPADFTKTTGEDGKALFENLTPGLYFVDTIRLEEEDGTIYTFQRVLVTIPELDEEGAWSYDVTADPKVDVYIPEKIMIDYRVNKLWKDEGFEENRPDSVSVTILKNSETYLEIELTAQEDWTYAWSVEDDGSVYQVVETEVPENYSMTSSSQGNVFYITNTYEEPTPPPPPPPTGDSHDVRIWVFLMAVSGVLFVCSSVFIYRRKRDNA